jgi:hypothetical protein
MPVLKKNIRGHRKMNQPSEAFKLANLRIHQCQHLQNQYSSPSEDLLIPTIPDFACILLKALQLESQWIQKGI